MKQQMEHKTLQAFRVALNFSVGPLIGYILLNVIVYFSIYCILFSFFVGYCILLHILEFSLYIIADYSVL